jgi:choice-of-anchor B domain-containing protein
MKKILLFFASVFTLSAFCQQSYPSLNINMMSHIDPEKDTTRINKNDFRKYSGCWGWYQASTKKEYAIAGTATKTYFIDITNPHSPIVLDSVLSHKKACTWRELKNYQNYLYVVSDDSKENNTFQIIDMKYLPDSVHLVYDDSLAYFQRAHTVWVDGNKLYVGGPTPYGASTVDMQVYSLANPEAPVLSRTLSDDYAVPYVHDMFVRNDTVYASAGNSGLQVFKFLSSSNTFTILGSLTSYPESGYNHSSSLTPDGKTLVFCDETPNTSIKVANVSDLNNITVSSMARPNTNASFVGHNPYVINNSWVVVSAYQDGLLLYNISDPANPLLMGYFDTYPQGGTGFVTDYGPFPWRGNWGAYPFFPSGTIMAIDMQNGLFFLEANNLLGTQAGVTETKQQTIIPIIYPNPANQNINISFMPGKVSACTIEITNVLGQSIYKEEDVKTNYPVTSKQFDISNYDNGTYILTIDTDDNVIRQKFIISK